MQLFKRIKNLIELSKIELSSEKKEQISNIIKQDKPRMAQIIHKKTEEDIIKELLNEK